MILYIGFFIRFSFGQGTTSFSFLQMPIGSRAQGMGGAYTALSNDINGIYFNPAGIGFGFRPAFMFYHAQWFEDIAVENVSFYYPNLNNFAISVGLSYLHLPEIEGYDIQAGNPEPINPYTVYNFVGQLGFSYRFLSNFSLGLQVKYLNEKLDNISTSGVAFDLGFRYRLPVNYLNFGVSILNLGPKIQYEQHKEDLPLTYRLGIAYRVPNSMITFALDAIKMKGQKWMTTPGIEVGFIENFALRAGYHLQQDIEAHYTLGFGLSFLDNYNINYVFAPYGVLGNTHRAEFVINFGGYYPGKETSTKEYKSYKALPSREIPVPTGLKSKQEGRSVYLTWDPVNIKKARYNVYVKIPDKTEIIKLTKDPISTNSYILNPSVMELKILVYISVLVNDSESYLSKPIFLKFKQ